MYGQQLGPDNAIWDDGEWISWDWINEQLEEQELRERYPHADPEIVRIFQDLLSTACDYFELTGRHLHVYGDIGELYGAITHGIKLHRNFAQGSDGRLGNDFIEIKTITPFNQKNRVEVNLDDRNFSKVLIVKVTEDYEVSGKLVDRKCFGKSKGKVRLNWDSIPAS